MVALHIWNRFRYILEKWLSCVEICFFGTRIFLLNLTVPSTLSSVRQYGSHQSFFPQRKYSFVLPDEPFSQLVEVTQNRFIRDLKRLERAAATYNWYKDKWLHKWFHSSRHRRLFWSHFLVKQVIGLPAVERFAAYHWYLCCGFVYIKYCLLLWNALTFKWKVCGIYNVKGKTLLLPYFCMTWLD